MTNSTRSAFADGGPLSPSLEMFARSRRVPRASRPIRVCHLGKFYPPHWGGIETHVRLLARAQVEAGASVRVICVNHLDESGSNVLDRNLTRTPTTEEHDGAVHVVRLGRPLSMAKLDVCPDLMRVLGDLRRDPVDIVHLHVPNPLMLLGLALLPPPTPLVVSYHSDVVHQKVLGKALRPFERWGLTRAARILTTSPPYASGSPLLGEFASKIEVVPLSVDLSAFTSPSPAARQHADELRRRYGAPLWLSVGRLVPYKAHAVALEALRHAPGRLMIVGDGPLETKLRHRAQELGVADRVIWRGAISDAELVGSYHAATALWFPSNARSEAFGLVQVEAMASGCPVINCSVPDSGVAWVSQHEKTGLTVPRDDPGALAAAARRLLDDPRLAARLRAGARERAVRKFGHDRMARESLDLYRQMQGGAVAPGVCAQ